MNSKRRIIYYFASLLNLIEALLLSIYCMRIFTDSYLISLFILAASVSFSFCVLCLAETFFSLENISSPELSSHIAKNSFLQMHGFFLFHGCLFCAICFFVGKAQWIIIPVAKEIILWCFAYPNTSKKFNENHL